MYFRSEENSKERNEKDEEYLRKVKRMEAVRKLELNYEDSPAQRAIVSYFNISRK